MHEFWNGVYCSVVVSHILFHYFTRMHHSPPQSPSTKEALSPLERKIRAITPPLDQLETTSCANDGNAMLFDDISEQPIPYVYLLNLFMAPDMRSYLAHTQFTEDVYALPIHLQRLISEAKEEVVIARTTNSHQHDDRATRRLQRLKDYIWSRSGHDVSYMLESLTELIKDEDELDTIIQE